MEQPAAAALIREIMALAGPALPGFQASSDRAGCLALVKALVEQAQRMTMLEHNYTLLQENLQKSEGDIRRHIRLQQQLKLYIDQLQEQVEEMAELLKEDTSPGCRKRTVNIREKKSKHSLEQKRSVQSRNEEGYLRVRQHLVQKRKGSEGAYRSSVEARPDGSLSDIKLRVELVSKLARGKQLSTIERESLLGKPKRRY